MNKDRNQRLYIKAKDITQRSFVIEYGTWWDSAIYAVNSNYIIIG
jgi:hypothetical protein